MDDESPMTLTLTADQPVYDSGVLTVNISWSAGLSQALHLDISVKNCANLMDLCIIVYDTHMPLMRGLVV